MVVFIFESSLELSFRASKMFILNLNKVHLWTFLLFGWHLCHKFPGILLVQHVDECLSMNFKLQHKPNIFQSSVSQLSKLLNLHRKNTYQKMLLKFKKFGAEKSMKIIRNGFSQGLEMRRHRHGFISLIYFIALIDFR